MTMTLDQHVRVTLLFLCCMTITACGGRGLSMKKNRICTSAEAPLRYNEKLFNNKLEVKPNAPLVPTVGDYAYEGAEYYYYNAHRDIGLHFIERKNSEGGYTAQLNCAIGQGISPEMTTLSESLPYVSDLKVDDDHRSFIRRKVIHFELGESNNSAEGWARVHTEVVDTDFIPGSPLETYPDKELVSQFFLTMVTSRGDDFSPFRLASFINDRYLNPRAVVDSTLPPSAPTPNIYRMQVRMRKVTAEQRAAIDLAQQKLRDADP